VGNATCKTIDGQEKAEGSGDYHGLVRGVMKSSHPPHHIIIKSKS